MAIQKEKLYLRWSLVGVLAIIISFIVLYFYLKPVILGLVLASLFLPFQQWLYNKFFNLNFPKKIIHFFVKILLLITFSSYFKRNKKKDFNENVNLFRHQISCFFTVLLCLVIIFLILLLIIYLPVHYSKLAQGRISDIFVINESRDLVQDISAYLESKPYYSHIKNYLSDLYISIVSLIKNLVIISLNNTMKFFFEITLTFFFFIFFLQTIAFFKKIQNSCNTIGDYIVESFFNSSWIPTVSNKIKNNVKEIINTIINKLRIWVHGYSKIIFFEIIYYFICFYFIDIPYAFILAMIAGLTILIPFIAPLLSIILTLGVYFSVFGNLNITIVVSILVIYGLMNIIIEQFLLLPTFVGNSLDLTTFETILVVLLGGIIFNIPGAILAIPIASILKYLIYKTYKTLK